MKVDKKEENKKRDNHVERAAVNGAVDQTFRPFDERRSELVNALS